MESFIEFIKSHGDEECAALFNTTRRAVASWRHKERRPSVKKAREISERCGIALHTIRPDVWEPPTTGHRT
jgi:transcriptional regulator with XRE-family HTH domain